jgi:lipopolysaccharide transport system permease protein
VALRTEAPLPVHERVWHENRPPEGWLPRLDLAELWSERELALVLALKDLRVRYKQTFFGIAWAILKPLAGVAIFTVFFGRLAHLPTDGLPYAVFVYSGLAIWLYFSSALTTSAQSLVDNRDLVAKVYFPRLLAPIAGVAPDLVDLGINLVVLGVFLVVYGVSPGPALATLPVWILAAVALAFAVGLWLASLNVKYRDVKYVLPFVLQLWLYASPVVYSTNLVQGAWRYLYALNPMVAVIDGFRWSLAGGPAPGPEALVSLAVGVAILCSGFVYFRRVESSFADLI